MCYVNSSVEQTLTGYVGQKDTLDDLILHVYADADLAGDRPSYKSTAGSFAEIAGPRTVFPFAARSKNITGTCSSTPEAEMASANMAYKSVGAPTLDLLDLICERKVDMVMFEDNTATIQIIKTGKNPTMRHLLRHQGINIRVLHETFYPRDPDTFELIDSQCHMHYIISAMQKADIFTKAFRDAVTWKKALGLIGISTLPRGPDGLPLALPKPPPREPGLWTNDKAARKATGGNAVANPALSSADRDLLTDLLEAHLRDYQVKGSKTRVNLRPHAERDQYGKLKEKIPSDVVTDGPIYHLVKLLNPDLWFEFVTINKFKNADECEHHFDTGNVGPSRLIMLGDLVGGGV